MAGKNVVSDDEDDVGVDELERDDEEPEDGERIDGDQEDDDEDDEDGQDEFEDDGFLVHDDDDEPEGDQDGGEAEVGERPKKRKKKKRDSEKFYELDEDDYELLEEQNITVPRPKIESKKFKRLKKAQRDTTEEHYGFSDEEVQDEFGKRGRIAEEKLKRSLFDEEGQSLDDIDEEPQEEDVDIDINDESDDDFIDYNCGPDGVPRGKKVDGKKSRQPPGASSIALQMAEDIFGHPEELMRLRAKDRTFDDHRPIEENFDPFELARRYMTRADNKIRAIDIPERMQISELSTGPPPTDEMSIEEESTWIYNQFVNSMPPLVGRRGSIMEDGNMLPTDKDGMLNDISRFLEFTHVQKLDVPFIAMYRREECLSLFEDTEQPEADTDEQINSEKPPTVRWHKMLWAIRDLDKEWLLIQKNKATLASSYEKRFLEESRRIDDETRLLLNRHLFESVKKSLKDAESEREIKDVDSKFNLHFSELSVDDGQYKRPIRTSQYSTCSKNGLWEVASKFGYSSEQFGLQISLEKMDMDELEDAKETPEEVASNFTCKMYSTPDDVLKGARHMAAIEISCEPSVRKYVRTIFMDNAVVSVSPTPEGDTAIDQFHQFAGVKWLRDKPLSQFHDAQWLLIEKAGKEKLLIVNIKLPELMLDKLISDSMDYYLSDSVSKSAQLWNEQRKLIIKDAFDSFLLPSMEAEARDLLNKRAKSWLSMEYGRLLWNKVSVAPYQRKEIDNSDEETAPRVMACCWGPGNPVTTFVMLDSSGEVLDVMYAGSLSLRGQSAEDLQRKTNDQDKVLKFIMDHQPHVVVLGAANLSCTKLKDDIYEIIFKMVEDNPREVGFELDNLNVVYGDESLPRIYENSRISTDQLPGQQKGIVSRAVALGRYLQNPLAMVATLCGFEREVLSWKLGSMDSYLTDEEKYIMVEQVMVDLTNQIGLDVNLAASHEWQFAPLQFISGLGPRMAAQLQRSLVKSGAIYTRKDLLNTHGLGKKVFVNAAGFLRVRRSGSAASNSQFIDLLDDTRIHPESYVLAQEFAKAVYTKSNDGDTFNDDDDDDDDDMMEMAVENVRENPNLKWFNIDKFAEKWNRQNKKETLNLIKSELMQGFCDWRIPYAEPNKDEEFNMISGENEETLCEGRIMQVTVRRVQPQRATCLLDTGLTGILTKEDYSDNWRFVEDLTEKLHVGDIITCRIKSIQKNRYHVFLTCRESEMRSNRHQNLRAMDPYYHEDRSILPKKQENAHKEKELAKKRINHRMIVHPRFQNITVDEAIEFLADKEPGESIVRPSSRGPTYLTLTLKICDGIYAHKDIAEVGKDRKDITSMLRIGKTLKIGEDTFDDLDEVMDRYVDPLVSNLKAMLSYRKFKRGTKAENDEVLRIEKSEIPLRIVYCFGTSHEHPGTFILTYIRNANPHHEYIGLYPNGFKFRKRMFKDLDHLVFYFQKHLNDPLDASPSIRSVAAMVPIRSPSTGGSSGFSGMWGVASPNNGGGWRDGQSIDNDTSSFPGSRTGRGDYRNGDSHPSGIPRPYGGGCGGGRGGRDRNGGSYDGGGGGRGSWGQQQDSNHGGGGGRQRWEARDGGERNWGSFPGAKVENSPGREAFPGGWGGDSSASRASSNGSGGRSWSSGWNP